LPRVLQGPELLHTVTHAETAEFAGLGFPRGRIREIPEGLFASEFRVQPDGEAFRARHDLRGPFVLFVGGLFFNKRLDVLLDAFRILEAEFPRLQLVCIGKSGDALGASWRARAERELGPRVRFLGVLPRAELLHAYAAADVFSLPSEFEGYGIVTIEAMACGTPFVNCATGNAPELAALGFGRVAAVGDAKGLAGHLRDYLADPQATRRAGAMARTYAMERLDWGALAPRFAAMFEEAIAIGARR
jgi:phosphatidylinositol alpha-1,6-mannosyltransferase